MKLIYYSFYKYILFFGLQWIFFVIISNKYKKLKILFAIIISTILIFIIDNMITLIKNKYTIKHKMYKSKKLIDSIIDDIIDVNQLNPI